MKCLHLPGMTGLFRHTPVLAALLVGLTLAGSPAAQATPAAPHHSTQAKKKSTPPSGAKASTRTTSHTKATGKKAKDQTRVKTSGKTSSKAAGKACSAPAKASSKHKRASKRRVPVPCPANPTAASVATGAVGATALPTGAATISPEVPTTGLQLPLMLRTTPSLPDNPAALQRRLDSLVAHQGTSAAGAEVSGVRQLAPDIYAFSLRCTDAQQCQRLRLAIEAERDWVAGLQLDERRNIPKPPERNSPSVR